MGDGGPAQVGERRSAFRAACRRPGVRPGAGRYEQQFIIDPDTILRGRRETRKTGYRDRRRGVVDPRAQRGDDVVRYLVGILLSYRHRVPLLNLLPVVVLQ